MAILKNISVHSTRGVESCIKYIDDDTKSTVQDVLGEIRAEEGDADVDNVLEYAQNLEKTVMQLDGEKSILVTGVNCYRRTASTEFAKTKRAYERHWDGKKRRER